MVLGAQIGPKVQTKWHNMGRLGASQWSMEGFRGLKNHPGLFKMWLGTFFKKKSVQEAEKCAAASVPFLT
jgi:hypothetical protein